MPTLLKDLKIKEVSSVDRGAGEGVQILLMKREAEADAYMKREFSEDKRKELASSGKALPDGSFPIENRSDLENAVHAFGRASDKDKAKAHIVSRARALGCVDCLPDGWDVSKNIIERLNLASAALFKSALAIFSSRDQLPVKIDALTETFDDFEKHLHTALPVEIAKSEATKGDTSMASEDEKRKEMEKAKEEAEKKAREEAEKAKGKGNKGGEEDEDNRSPTEKLAEAKSLLAKAHSLLISKLAPTHQAYMDAQAWDDKDKQHFLEMSPAERDDHMEKNPIIGKNSGLPPGVIDLLKRAEANEAKLAKLLEKDEQATFAKRAEEIGLSTSQGEILRKAYKGDGKAIAELESLIKGLNAQVEKGALFGEIGSRTTQVNKVADEFELKVNEYMKAHPTTEKGRPMTRDIAFSKVYVDPANAALKKRYDAEESTKLAKIASAQHG